MNASSPPDLSVLITSWNAKQVLLDCLKTLPAACARHTSEVIVVDNASADGTSEAVQALAEPIRLVRLEHNRGFSAGNNAGLPLCRGRYVILLNSDTLVPPQAFDALIAFMDAHPQAGMCGPRLEHPNRQTQAFAFGGDPTLAYLLRRQITRLLFKRPLHDWNTRAIQPVDWVAGTALLARQAVIQAIGGLDENFYAYFEDNDWCRRARLAGWQVYYVPTVTIIHLGGYSLRKDPAARQAYLNSLRYFYRKHYPPLAQGLLDLLTPVYQRVNP